MKIIQYFSGLIISSPKGVNKSVDKGKDKCKIP